MFEVIEISYKEIFPVWREFLWKNRKNEINPMSSMLLNGSYDMEIYEKYKPTFLGVYVTPPPPPRKNTEKRKCI